MQSAPFLKYFCAISPITVKQYAVAPLLNQYCAVSHKNKNRIVSTTNIHAVYWLPKHCSISVFLDQGNKKVLNNRFTTGKVISGQPQTIDMLCTFHPLFWTVCLLNSVQYLHNIAQIQCLIFNQKTTQYISLSALKIWLYVERL